MKSLLKIFGITLVSAMTFTACIDDDVNEEYCTYTIENPVVEVNGHAAGTVGQEVTLNVKFNSGNGCYSSSGFTESGTNPKVVTVNSSYIGCVCTQVTEVVTKEYKFTPASVGEYKFKFKANTTFIEKTVTVTQ